MIRFRSTHDDRLTSLSSRTTRHLATIEAARARHSLDDVARLASHGHFERSLSLQLHLDDGISALLRLRPDGSVVERACQSEAVGWRQTIRILDSGYALAHAWAAHESSPSRRGLFFTPTPGEKVLRDSRSGCRDDPCPGPSGDGRWAGTVTVRAEALMNESFITDNQLLVTPEEAARRLSVGRTTIYELMASGELQSVNIGRCRRVPVISLSLFVNRLIGDAVVEPRRQ